MWTGRELVLWLLIRLRLSTAILPRPLPQTRKVSEEEREDPEPGRSLAFGAVAANRAAENPCVKAWHEENWAKQLRDHEE